MYNKVLSSIDQSKILLFKQFVREIKVNNVGFKYCS